MRPGWTLFLMGCAANSGPIPVDYGWPCNPAVESCSNGMDCVKMGRHAPNPDSPIAEEYACATPCTVDQDCPRHTCGQYDGAQDPYDCRGDGYCVLTTCVTGDFPPAPE